jgi:hypothetical protein
MSIFIVILGTMRDDRYRGTSLPRLVRKLCRMTEREADRARSTQIKLLRLLNQHRVEWNAFMSSLPQRSWVRDIVGQL